ADTPTILATSGGLRRGRRTEIEFSPLVLHAIELSGATGRPRLCHIGTAGGDQRGFQAWLSAAGEAQGITVTHLSLFAMPSTGDMTGLLLEQDVVGGGGGSVANLLALRRGGLRPGPQARPAPASSPGAAAAAAMKPATTLLNSSGEVDGQLWPWCGAIHSRPAGSPPASSHAAGIARQSREPQTTSAGAVTWGREPRRSVRSSSS